MRFILSIVGVILFIIAIIVIISQGNTTTIDTRKIDLAKYNYPGTSLTQTTSGNLVGNDQRAAIRLTISQSERTVYLLSTYDQTVVNSESFPNTPAAYGAFLGAMQNAGYTNSKITSQKNIYGVCPLGSTYQYQFNNANSIQSNLWSTSCTSGDGTFVGNGPLIRQLFTLQIPNYKTFTQPYNIIAFTFY